MRRVRVGEAHAVSMEQVSKSKNVSVEFDSIWGAPYRTARGVADHDIEEVMRRAIEQIY